MEPIKLVCQTERSCATELYVTVDRLREFTSLIEHLNPETNTIKLNFCQRDVRHALELLPENESNNSRPPIYRERVNHTEIYRFNCKYGGIQLDQYEKELLEESEWNPNCIVVKIFNTAYKYDRPAIVRRVNNMLRSETLCQEYCGCDHTNLDGIDGDLKLDMLLFEHEFGSGWVFNTIDRIREDAHVVSSRHLKQLNELLMEAHYDKKLEFYENDVRDFVKFVTDQGFSSKEKIDKERCTCDYGDYECFGHYYKFYI